ncbi:DEAD/DEAH box helicase [Telluribacter sp.]|jgi:SNF2 family DNA or RNA helicase|uniref:DEAD/DEAH box helicase n=1 Tax=Telluribacter sp. TaxID=1978767 RepID=UPI002E150B09|nr:SNF2-related protein [Telluribacter sp.]
MKEENLPYEPYRKARLGKGVPGSETSEEDFLSRFLTEISTAALPPPAHRRIIVIGKHKYYDLFTAQLMDTQVGPSGELKSPFLTVNPIDLIWKTREAEDIQFYAAIVKFQAFYEKSLADSEGLKALIRNPFNYPCFFHDSSITEKASPRSLSPVSLSTPPIDFKVRISLGEKLYHIQGDLYINKVYVSINQISVRFEQFLTVNDNWYLCPDTNLVQAIAYFKRHGNVIRLSYDEFLRFQTEVLSEMETHVQINHSYLKPASKIQLKKAGFDQAPEKLIYLSDLGDYVLINPVLKYGDVEIPVLSRRQIYAQDHKGSLSTVERNSIAEDQLVGLLLKQHPDFLEQLENPLLYFYLHKSRFLDETWFLDVFEEWSAENITVLGFQQLKGNNLSPHKGKLSIQIASGLNWFNALVEVKYGRKKASLKQLQKSVRNKTKFVQLDDGTLGILPEEWLQKLEAYFSAGEVEEAAIRIPKNNFTVLDQLFETRMLDQEVREEVLRYRSKLTDWKAIEPAPVPAGLRGTLRPYQRQGLSWLNFLDDFGFGGCLADDMGLGKSIQIIAFILLLREKSETNTNLLVVPTSLLHNWENEISKFAPTLRVYTLHGSGRVRSTKAFGEYEVVLTSYGTLISDISFLKSFEFNYIFLDESQNIKNISSQRYKAARLLKSRNRIAISGTPIENNTFDLYAQLSFACPGLLGTRLYFKNTFAIPIDRFKEKRSALALQERIASFILRRTKQEVAGELPEKTEIVLYCEMGAEQRKVYDQYEREFREYLTLNPEEVLAQNPMHVLKGITRLRQICNSPLLIGDEKLYGDSSVKIEMLMDQIRSVTGRHKILVFSQFVSMLDLIRKEVVKEGIGHCYLTGSTRNREEVIQQFQQDETKRVFLISLKAGGTGLNLTAADYVFIVDPWWNPAVENQAIDRSYRIGQKKNVIAVRLLCPDTVEEKILQMQQNKTKLTSDLISTGDTFFKSLTKSDLLHLTSPSGSEPLS